MAEGALSGLKLVEYCSFVAGPYCTRLFADLGAEVIKIEPPDIGDEARRRGPFLNDVPHPDLSGLFLYANNNKMGITLNLDSAVGREIFKRLIANADILVEDRPPGEMEEKRLGYETLKEINPSLIMASVTPFGQTGPYRNYKSYHLTTFHASGDGYLLPSNSPNLEREPLKIGGLVGEYDAGTSVAIAILAAYFWRQAGGKGQYIDFSKQEALMQLEKANISRFYDDKKSPSRRIMGNARDMVINCMNNGYMLLEYYQENQWKGLVEAMGNPAWASAEEFKTPDSRQKYAIKLHDNLLPWTMKYTAEELFHKIQGCKTACAPVNSPADVVNSTQIEARGFIVEVDHPVAGKVKYPSWPYRFSKTPATARQPAPLLGQHNEEVLCNRLGYSRQDMVKFKEAGII